MTKSGFDIDEIERLLAAATPGKWYLQTGALGVNPWISGPNWTRPDGSYVRGGCILNMVAHDEREQDAALIVAARNSLPAMISELRELRAENARLREMTATNKQAWDNALEFGIIPERHRSTVQIMSDGCRAALGEPQ